jgi:hypothetical protein
MEMTLTGRPDLQRDPAGPRQWLRRPAMRLSAIAPAMEMTPTTLPVMFYSI